MKRKAKRKAKVRTKAKVKTKVMAPTKHKTKHKTKRARKNRIKVRWVRKNPFAKFFICAVLERSGKRYYYRASTKSFVPTLDQATVYKSRALAERTAYAIVGHLPSQIRSIKVERI